MGHATEARSQNMRLQPDWCAFQNWFDVIMVLFQNKKLTISNIMARHTLAN